MSGEPRRKRYKVECCECKKKFDNDYQKKHELIVHGGKSVKVKVVGAAENPFQLAAFAAEKKKRVSLRLTISTYTYYTYLYIYLLF